MIFGWSEVNLKTWSTLCFRIWCSRCRSAAKAHPVEYRKPSYVMLKLGRNRCNQPFPLRTGCFSIAIPTFDCGRRVEALTHPRNLLTLTLLLLYFSNPFYFFLIFLQRRVYIGMLLCLLGWGLKAGAKRANLCTVSRMTLVHSLCIQYLVVVAEC